jgi:hypothetical protein
MNEQKPKPQPSPDDVLRKMLATPPAPKKAKPKQSKKPKN